MIPAQALAGIAIAGGGISMLDAFPYIRDTLRRTTRPHRGTWLIWTALSWIALSSNWADGATWSLIPLLAQAVQNCLILVLSVSRGEGGVSRPDRLMLATAGLGIVGWRLFSDPTIATWAVVVADVMGALMMVPKSWADPWSETASTFVLSSVVGVAALGSVGEFRAALVIYPLYYILVNGALAVLLMSRRRSVPAPAPAGPGTGLARQGGPRHRRG